MGYKSDKLLNNIGAFLSGANNTWKEYQNKKEKQQMESMKLSLSQVNDELKIAMEAGDTAGMFDILARKKLMVDSLISNQGSVVRAMPAQPLSQQQLASGGGEVYGTGMGRMGQNIQTIADLKQAEKEMKMKKATADLKSTELANFEKAEKIRKDNRIDSRDNDLPDEKIRTYTNNGQKIWNEAIEQYGQDENGETVYEFSEATPESQQKIHDYALKQASKYKNQGDYMPDEYKNYKMTKKEETKIRKILNTKKTDDQKIAELQVLVNTNPQLAPLIKKLIEAKFGKKEKVQNAK